MERKQLLVFIIILAMAVSFRFVDLDLKPVHHDESAHADMSWDLYKIRAYKYDPIFHGPLLYFTTAFVYLLTGRGDDTLIRIIPSFLGVLLVVMLLPLKKYLGKYGFLTSAFLLAASPSFVYFSRFLRNDIYMAVYTLAIVVFIIKFRETKEGKFIPIISAVILLGLLQKENIYLIVFSFLSFLIIEWAYRTLKSRTVNLDLVKRYWRFLLLGIAIMVVGYAAVYSEGFLHINYLNYAFLEAFKYWFGQHNIARLGGPFYYYIGLLFLYEPPILALGIAALIFIPLRRYGGLNNFNYLVLYWFISSLIIYSYLQEKVPWLILHILLPMAILSGIVSEKFIERSLIKGRIGRIAAGVFILLLIVFFVFTSFHLNFITPANPTELHTQVQTSNDLYFVINKVDDLSKEFGKENVTIWITSPDYWPLPWYFKENDVTYYSEYPEEEILKEQPMIIIASPEQKINLWNLKTSYYQSKTIKLREWYLPEYEKVTVSELIKYYLIRQEFSPTGSTKIVVMWKEPPTSLI